MKLNVYFMVNMWSIVQPVAWTLRRFSGTVAELLSVK